MIVPDCIGSRTRSKAERQLRASSYCIVALQILGFDQVMAQPTPQGASRATLQRSMTVSMDDRSRHREHDVSEGSI